LTDKGSVMPMLGSIHHVDTADERAAYHAEVFVTENPSAARVFVSSVVEGFEACREAASAGIRDAGAEPVLVNEQFPALNSSSRNACLDAVASSDVFLLLIGRRGGWRTPSGRLVVEEELAEARRRKLPVFVFIEAVQREPDAQQLVREVSDYVNGYFRVEFHSPAQLRAEVARALAPHVAVPVRGRMSIDPIAVHLDRPYSFHDQATLRYGIAPERNEEVFDPMRLHSEDFQHRLLELGHRRDVALFHYQSAKEPLSIGADELVIEQPMGSNWRQGRYGVRLAIAASGLVLIDANVTGRSEREDTFSVTDVFTIDTEVVGSVLQTEFRFVNALYDEIDPHKRYARFLWNAALSGLGHRSFVRGPQSQKHSYSMNMRDTAEPLRAHATARVLTRAELADPQREIDRALLYWEKQRNSGG
jgi:hypothetical protein